MWNNRYKYTERGKYVITIETVKILGVQFSYNKNLEHETIFQKWSKVSSISYKHFQTATSALVWKKLMYLEKLLACSVPG